MHREDDIARHLMMRLLHPAFLQNDDAIIVMDGIRRASKFCYLQPLRLFGVPGVQLVDEIFGVFDKTLLCLIAASVRAPVRGAQILAQVQPVVCDVRIEDLEGDSLLVHGVPAIIEQNIEPGDLFF